MSKDDFYKIEFARNEKVDKFLKELDLKEGNMYIVLKPEDEGFEIVGADLLPADLDPRNPSFAYKNKYNEHVENTDQFNNYIKSTEVKKVFSGMKRKYFVFLRAILF